MAGYVRQAGGPGAAGTLPTRATTALLHDLAPPDLLALLGDKLRSGAWLRSIGVPTPEVVAIIRGPDDLAATAPLWRGPRDLFVKPVTGRRGAGGFRLTVLADGTARVDDRPAVAISEVARHLAARSRDRTLLAQVRLNSDSVLPFAVPGVHAPFVRLTVLKPPGRPAIVHDGYVVVHASGRPAGTGPADTIRYPVDPATGAILPGVRFDGSTERFTHDPASGVQVAGHSLPDFAGLAALVCRASDALERIAVVGWDVILTADGPVILEGNTGLAWAGANIWHLETGRPSRMSSVLADLVRATGLPDRPAASSLGDNRRGGRK
ncbi:MAG: sugar-transfer associated ATP-grasp domain-containing protein [Pseudomonadota bacterium]|nr:sugar-transfer associated ATP-grasp domain-containing protein [Pseudomonadota bacterium]